MLTKAQRIATRQAELAHAAAAARSYAAMFTAFLALIVVGVVIVGAVSALAH